MSTIWTTPAGTSFQIELEWHSFDHLLKVSDLRKLGAEQPIQAKSALGYTIGNRQSWAFLASSPNETRKIPALGPLIAARLEVYPVFWVLKLDAERWLGLLFDKNKNLGPDSDRIYNAEELGKQLASLRELDTDLPIRQIQAEELDTWLTDKTPAPVDMKIVKMSSRTPVWVAVGLTALLAMAGVGYWLNMRNTADHAQGVTWKPTPLQTRPEKVNASVMIQACLTAIKNQPLVRKGEELSGIQCRVAGQYLQVSLHYGAVSVVPEQHSNGSQMEVAPPFQHDENIRILQNVGVTKETFTATQRKAIANLVKVRGNQIEAPIPSLLMSWSEIHRGAVLVEAGWNGKSWYVTTAGGPDDLGEPLHPTPLKFQEIQRPTLNGYPVHNVQLHP